MQAVRHHEIVEKFLQSKAVDFAALGKFVTENGPSIVASGIGDYGVRFGHYNILACFNIGPIPALIDARLSSEISREVTGSMREGTTAR
ncbi:MAG: hypothetical protein ACREPZ_09715 [Rhodanobacteraceae bacterium]